MNRSFFFAPVLVFLLLSGTLAAQNKYFIRFKNKSGTPYTIQSAEKFLTKRSIERRARYNIPFTASDLPVVPAYLEQLRAVHGTQLRYPLKWLNGAVVSFAPGTDSAALAAINQLPFVDAVGKIKRVRRSPDPENPSTRTSGANHRASSGGYDYGEAFTQAEQLNIPCLHERGFRGQGMVIAVMDAGFASVPVTTVFDSLRTSGRILGTRDFVNGGTNAYVGGDHGTMVLSCMAALEPGRSIGTAPLASYWLLRTEEGGAETLSEEYNWIRAAEFADSVGADILTTSLGYTEFDDSLQNHTYASLDGRTAPMSIAATMAARKGMFVLNAAGNEGDKAWHFIVVAGDADSIVTVGSVNGINQKSPFSSVGPTADGRFKPDFMARGEGCWVCTQDVCFPGNGTSFATPVLAGAVACYWQANRVLNNIQLMKVMRATADGALEPTDSTGWGLPDLCEILYTPYRRDSVVQALPLPKAQTMDFTAFAFKNAVRVTLDRADYGELEIAVCDALGKVLFSATRPGNEYDVYLQTPGLAAGVYVIRVTSPVGSSMRKVLKLDL